VVNADAEPVRTPHVKRVVVLGASNVIRGISPAFSVARAIAGGPVDFVAACGHGRSYGMKTWVSIRALPGIEPCGVWKALESRPPLPTVAVLTDIGNDLIYGVSVDRVTSWVRTCAGRLRDLGAGLALTALPLQSLERMPPARFMLFRRIMFPHSRLTYETGLQRARETNAAVQQIASETGGRFVEQDAQWYGLDPIHIRRRFQVEAWRRFCAAWLPGGARTSPGWRQWLAMRFKRPDQRWLAGVEQRGAQPAARFKDGSSASFY